MYHEIMLVCADKAPNFLKLDTRWRWV